VIISVSSKGTYDLLPIHERHRERQNMAVFLSFHTHTQYIVWILYSGSTIQLHSGNIKRRSDAVALYILPGALPWVIHNAIITRLEIA